MKDADPSRCKTLKSFKGSTNSISAESNRQLQAECETQTQTRQVLERDRYGTPALQRCSLRLTALLLTEVARNGMLNFIFHKSQDQKRKNTAIGSKN